MTKLEPDDITAEAEHAPHTPKMRQCLKCRKTFESAWAGERICARCKGGSEWRRGAGSRPHPAARRR